MGGVIVFTVIIIWFVVSLKLARMLFNKLNPKRCRGFVLVALSILVFIAPVTDEIIGGFQFRALCNAPDNLVYDPDKLRGKTIQRIRTLDHWVWQLVSIRVNERMWVDASSGESLFSYKKYYADGGALKRLIGYPQGGRPYTFEGRCSPAEVTELLKELEVKQVNGYYGE